RTYGSKVISRHISKLWTGGGARGIELETPQLVYLLLGLTSIRMSNHYNFSTNGSMGCHRLKSGRSRIIIIINIAASSNTGAKHKEENEACQRGWEWPTATMSHWRHN
ncbi:MAG: hypothetical protein ACRCW3_03970, partial [Metamycoplasmataceae bacterium]